MRALDKSACDVTESFSVQRVFAQLRPDVVLHCAALSNVEVCETRPDLAYRVNAQGTANVAAACQRFDARLIAYSTARVFDGASRRSYRESDAPNPQTAYGRSKLAAEQLIQAQCDRFVVMRLSWVFGLGEGLFGVKWLNEAARSGPTLRVPSDATGNLTAADQIADATLVLLERVDSCGIVHWGATGETTWLEAARQVAKITASHRRIEPGSLGELARPGRLRCNASLAVERWREWGLTQPSLWAEQLARHWIQATTRRAAAA